MVKKRSQDEIETDFINLTSHQLRTPLSNQKWLLELLQKVSTGNLNRKQKDFLDKIYRSNERMIGLVNNLLEISRLDSGDSKIFLQPTDIASVMRDLVKDREKEVKQKNLNVTLTIEREPFVLVRTEPAKIKQALGNIINNAVTFTPENGKIAISLKVQDNQVLGEVTDTGAGIPQDQQHRLFRKFFRGSNAVNMETNGSGLGLYITKAFIEESGGKIWFKSKEQKGTSIFFSLPISK